MVKRIEDQQNQIDEIFEKFDSIQDEYFTEDEASELKNRLDKLEENLQAEIRTKNEDKKIFEQEISKLHTDIDTLKQTISSFKKKGWLRSFTGKIFKWSKNSENRKLLADGYKVIREFLPEHIKTSLPE